jgi:hypothetical protein
LNAQPYRRIIGRRTVKLVYMTLHAQVLDFIHYPNPARFERTALAVFAHQFGSLSPYREFCLSRARRPDSVRSVAEIPAVSTAAFKYVEFCSAKPQRVFLTSGTTRGRDQRGRHFVADLELYRVSATKHLKRMLLADGCRPWMLALHPTADRMPESSLSQMISWCIESFGGTKALCCASPQRVDCRAALDFLRIAESAGEPVCVLGTTAALSELFEHTRLCRAPMRLAAGSRLMHTGGAKGQAKPLSADEVLAMAQEYLAIPSAYVINEYGMTELCSQLYDATSLNCPGASDNGERVKIAPPWLKVFARDPGTLRPLAPGELGLLSFFDLANAGSVSALLTEDLGVVNADGTVRILGRIINSDPRGCALGIDQFARREGTPSPYPLRGQGEGAERELVAKRLATRMAKPAVDLQEEAADQRTPGRYTTDSKTSGSFPSALSLTRERVGVRVPVGPGKSETIEETASRLRGQLRERVSSDRIAEALARACGRWREPGFRARAATLAAAAAFSGQSPALLGASLEALLASFTADAMLDLARLLATRDRLIGFVMPGNVMGAGLHELAQALIGGASVIVKASSLEPLFFAEFRRSLADIDASVAARIEVVVWDRSDRESTMAMARSCDRIVAFGDDDTIAAIAAIAGPKLIGFGSRLSGALLSRDSIAGPRAQPIAAALARDVSLFDQRGCLSLHHVFIEAPRNEDACKFAELMAAEMAALARSMPSGAIRPIAEMTAARAARENARWRRIGGAPLVLWEGEDLAWTVIFDPEAGFQPSPLCRTVCVSTVENQNELPARLSGVAQGLEGFAIDDPANRLEASRALLREIGVSYFCAPGQMQSPPPSWAHGGGRFLRLMEAADG